MDMFWGGSGRGGGGGRGFPRNVLHVSQCLLWGYRNVESQSCDWEPPLARFSFRQSNTETPARRRLMQVSLGQGQGWMV